MFHCCRNDVVCRNNNAVSVSRINSLFLSPIVGMVIANCGLLWINCKEVWLCIERDKEEVIVCDNEEEED